MLKEVHLPLCTPTRMALMTGQRPVGVGIRDYVDAKDEKFLSPETAQPTVGVATKDSNRFSDDATLPG